MNNRQRDNALAEIAGAKWIDVPPRPPEKSALEGDPYWPKRLLCMPPLPDLAHPRFVMPISMTDGDATLSIPKYTESLDAMAKLEKHELLTDHDRSEYQRILQTIIGPGQSLTFADAPQRAEAMLRFHEIEP